tara:strand:+ start:377 stop:556 length:180 start_codon:yes stop_codon:yes gene_type:complete
VVAEDTVLQLIPHPEVTVEVDLEVMMVHPQVVMQEVQTLVVAAEDLVVVDKLEELVEAV